MILTWILYFGVVINLILLREHFDIIPKENRMRAKYGKTPEERAPIMSVYQRFFSMRDEVFVFIDCVGLVVIVCLITKLLSP